MTPLSDVPVIVPVGGLATRAREITHDLIPKHLIVLGEGRTVLSVVCQALQAVGFRRFVFCVGHHKHAVVRYIREENWITHTETSYDLSEELTPLGPDGAVLQAITCMGHMGPALIIPGDALLPWAQIAEMCTQHMQHGQYITTAVTVQAQPSTLVINENSHLGLPGKESEGLKFVKAAGVTIVQADVFRKLCETYTRAQPSQDCMLNLVHTILPWALSVGIDIFSAYELTGDVLDVGTPENICHAQLNWQRFAL